MYANVKSVAVSVCLVASLATPVWAGDQGPTADPRVIQIWPAPPAGSGDASGSAGSGSVGPGSVGPGSVGPWSVGPASVGPGSAGAGSAGSGTSAATGGFDKVPSGVTINGKAVTFEQAPVMIDGMLFLPLRTIAEAAGGKVTWDQALKLIHVRMPERTIMIHLGNPAVEMNQDGVYYLTRNMVQMPRMPAVVGGRTMISADVLAAIFGFQVQAGQNGSLALVSPTKPGASPGVDQTGRGSISQVEQKGDYTRILLAGDLMANGERRLTWASISATTRITVREGAQTRAGSMADIKVGPQVEVTWVGPLLMTYPAQGAAAEIVVHK